MRHIGRYRLVAEIGHGGMADVYLALASGPNGFNKTVVVKALRGETPNEQSVAMFLDEARIAARLNHPNIVQTHEVGEQAGRPFLAMEFVEGQSLQSILRRARGAAPLPVLLRVLSDLLAALDYAHELTDFDGSPLDLVHRDVTPHNVIVSYEGYGKLLDFGIAKANVRSAQTQTGMLKGKVAYMSPEQANGAAIDRRSDLFAVGVMLYQALSGRRYWGEEQDMPVLVKLASGQLPDVRPGLAGVSPALAAVAGRAVAVSPVDRYASAGEFQTDLERAAGALASRRDVGAYVSGLFASERAGLRDELDRHSSREYESAGARSRRSAAESELPRFHMSGALPAAGDGSGSLPKTSVTGALLPAPSVPVPAAKRGGLALRVAAVGALAAGVAIAITGVYVLRGAPPSAAFPGGSPAEPATHEATGAKAETHEATAKPGAHEAAKAAGAHEAAKGGAHEAAKAPGGREPTKASEGGEAVEAAPGVIVTLEARPSQARLFLDDRPLATNPASVPLAAAGEHRVRAEAEGFATASQSVTASAGESVTLTLRPLRGRAAPPPAAAAPARANAAAAAKAPPAQPPRDNGSSSAAKGADLAGF